MPQSTQTDRKVAIVTGAGRGIGAACARALAERGFTVALMSPSDRSIRLAETLGGYGRQGSVLSREDLSALVSDVMARYGRIDAVVNNMGHGGGLPEEVPTLGYDADFEGSVLDIPDEVWHESLDMYVLSVAAMARLVTPIMIDQGGGSIVNISSPNAIEPRQMYPMSALRGALHSFTKLYADRYARHNVRMNNLLPGFCENVALSERAIRDIPMARPAAFGEIASVCAFLASAEASYLTGQNILVDGGVNRAVR